MIYRTASLLGLLVVAAFSQFTQEQTISKLMLPDGQVWLSPIIWKKKPHGIKGHHSNAKILQFRSNGDFRMGEVFLLRNADGTIGVSVGDGYIRYTGNWKVEANRVHISYHPDSPTRLVSRPHITGPTENVTLAVSKNIDQVHLGLKWGKVLFQSTSAITRGDIAMVLNP